MKSAILFIVLAYFFALVLVIVGCAPTAPKFEVACSNLSILYDWPENSPSVCVSLFKHFYQDFSAKGRGPQYRDYVNCLSTATSQEAAVACRVHFSNQ